MIRYQPSATLFPYTTLFRSGFGAQMTRMVDSPADARFVFESRRDDRAGLSLAARDRAAASGKGRCRGPMARQARPGAARSEEHTSELQSQSNLVCRLLLEKK